MFRNASILILSGVIFAAAGCSGSNFEAERAKAKAEAARAQSETDHARLEAELAKAKAQVEEVRASTPPASAQPEDKSQERKRRRQEIERRILDLETELRVATKKDEENNQWNERKRKEQAKVIEDGERLEKKLRAEGKSGQAFAVGMTNAAAKSAYESNYFPDRRETNQAEKIRDQIDKLKRELIDLND